MLMDMVHLNLRPIGRLFVFIVVVWISMPSAFASSSALSEGGIGQHPKSDQAEQPLLLAKLANKFGYHSTWFEGQTLSKKARNFISFLYNIEAEGLEPGSYQRDEILTISDKDILDRADILRIKFLLDRAFLKLGMDLMQGQADWERYDPAWFIPRNSVQLDHLASILNSDASIINSLKELNPGHESFSKLKNALHKYQEIVRSGGWNSIETNLTLKLGMENPEIGKLRKRLAIVGDLNDSDAQESNLFDKQLLIAVKKFQARHGLKPDGLVGPLTRGALNVSADERLQQIKINMERWRWMPRDLGDDYIMVNTPAFSLSYVWKQESLLTMRVIVGDEKHPTPVLTKHLTYADINPVWNVPRKIVTEEILPKLAMKPDYLEQNGFKILSDWSADARELTLEETGWPHDRVEDFPYRLQQAAGDDNALGRIKFIFPNEFSVYLHDTPSKGLFKKEQRTLSHGCIRVEKPEALALALFIEQFDPWDNERLDEVMASGENIKVILENPIPVYLVYFTSWVDEAGTVHFSRDFYDRDRPLARELFLNH